MYPSLRSSLATSAVTRAPVYSPRTSVMERITAKIKLTSCTAVLSCSMRSMTKVKMIYIIVTNTKHFSYPNIRKATDGKICQEQNFPLRSEHNYIGHI